jgi:hypothetical protein
MSDTRLDPLSDDDQRTCDDLASWAGTIIVAFDLSIVLAVLYYYWAPQPGLAVVTTWTWATLMGGAVACCALLIWLTRQPAFGQARERLADDPASN